jgi:hypothetical protein
VNISLGRCKALDVASNNRPRISKKNYPARIFRKENIMQGNFLTGNPSHNQKWSSDFRLDGYY